jgi:MOSC domain-containing protein YiiM
MVPRLLAIYISPAATILPISVTEAEARAHTGLAGDRYCTGNGTFSGATPKGPGRELTLIESEVLQAVEAEQGIRLSAAQARRNLVTEGVRLNDLVGVKFRIGDVLMEGIRFCDPCMHLNVVTGLSLLKPLANRGGLRAAVLNDGVLRVGDEIHLTATAA